MKNFYLLLILFFNISCFEKAINSIAGSSKFEPKDFQKKATPETIQYVQNSLSGLDLNKIVDYHTHLVGMNEKETGAFVNPHMKSVWHFKENTRYKVYLSALKVNNPEKADSESVARLLDLVKNLPYKPKHFLLAFDKHYNESGEVNLAKTEFYTPNEYSYRISEEYKEYFLPCISIHPYRKDAIKELEKWGKLKVKIIKWLPNAQGIDPSNPKLEKFYKKMIELKMVLLTHAGEERAVEADEDQKYGNPLLLRYPLGLGVKVIIAHAASLGFDIDLDDVNKIKLPSFDLFLRLMNEKKYQKNLFADISAVVQFNRDKRILQTLLERKDLHNRLVHGSDYPLPAVNLVIRLSKLKKFLSNEEQIHLKEIYEYNPILFEFILKRNLNFNGNKFSDSIFMENENLNY